MELLFELSVADSGVRRPSAQAIYELLKEAIFGGQLVAGSKLPPTRQAGQHFRVSRNTMVSIYERLANEGLVVSRAGSGTFVARRRSASRVLARPQLPSTSQTRALIEPTPAQQEMADNIRFWSADGAREATQRDIELRPALVDLSLFPFREFRRCVAKTLRRMEQFEPARNSPHTSQGSLRLREAIVDHAALMRALVAKPEEIIVTSGAQQAFDLIARTFVKPGTTIVAVEEPSYPPLVAAFIGAGAQLCRVPVDDQGLIVERIPEAAKLVCICPSNQYPLGITMSESRRRQLCDFAEQQGALIVEDDYDGEFRTEGEPLKAVYRAQTSHSAFYVGTFSKCMFPSLRLGYIVAPPWAIERLTVAKASADWCTSSVVQGATAEFIRNGHLSAHVARMRALYRERRAAVAEAVPASFNGRLRLRPSNYGMHLSAFGEPDVDWEALARRSANEGIHVHSLSRYYGTTPLPGLVFGIGAEPIDRLTAGIERLSTFT